VCVASPWREYNAFYFFLLSAAFRPLFTNTLKFNIRRYDAYRVASNAEMEVGHMFEAKMELTIGKVAELFAESIPGKNNCVRVK
jgi:hypothetical protein